MREMCADLLADVIEQTPHCQESTCQIAFRQRLGRVEIEHVDATQDHPFGAVYEVSVESLQRVSHRELIARLVRWLEQAHPVPNVRLLSDVLIP